MLMMLPSALAAGLETVLNRCLSLNPDTLPQWAALEGAVIAIEPEGLSLTLYVLLMAQGLRVMDQYTGEPTVHIRGTPLALFRQWRGQPAGRDLSIEGDAAVGRQFQALLSGLNIDWEEQLSQVVGDVAAHQVGRFWRRFQHWGRQSAEAFWQDGSEYLQYERAVVPSRPAVESFLDAVDALREDTDRLAARIARLQRFYSP